MVIVPGATIVVFFVALVARYFHPAGSLISGLLPLARVFSLLAVTFEPAADPAQAPSGAVVLTFAGGGGVRLEVECIEGRLADLGAAWEARAKPAHEAG